MNHPPPSSAHFGHQGRVVLVTGAAQGIGEACARRFAREVVNMSSVNRVLAIPSIASYNVSKGGITSSRA